MPKIDVLFEGLLSNNGSDLHLGVGYPPLIRTRGSLVALREQPLDITEIETLLSEILTSEQHDRMVETKDLDCAYAYEDKARFRVNCFYKTTGLAAVFRTIPNRIQPLGDLRCPDAVRKLAERRSGLVLVAGPTGCGKSTTLAAMLDHINRTRACHILTIEDPVEFIHTSDKAQVTHRQVGLHAPSFSSAIRGAAREDPDVILIGELHNSETMKLALQLASFGILVFSSVHTNNATATIERMINAFAADEQQQVRGLLADSLAGIIAQQLLATTDGKERVAAHEILVGTTGLSAMIRDGKMSQVPSLIQTGQALGMQTMDMAIERLLTQGLVSVDEAVAKATDKERIAKIAANKAPE